MSFAFTGSPRHWHIASSNIREYQFCRSRTWRKCSKVYFIRPVAVVVFSTYGANLYCVCSFRIKTSQIKRVCCSRDKVFLVVVEANLPSSFQITICPWEMYTASGNFAICQYCWLRASRRICKSQIIHKKTILIVRIIKYSHILGSCRENIFFRKYPRCTICRNLRTKSETRHLIISSWVTYFNFFSTIRARSGIIELKYKTRCRIQFRRN